MTSHVWRWQKAKISTVLLALLLLAAAGCSLLDQEPRDADALDAYLTFTAELLEDIEPVIEAAFRLGQSMAAYNEDPQEEDLKERAQLLHDMSAEADANLADLEVPEELYATQVYDGAGADAEEVLDLAQELAASGEKVAVDMIAWIDGPTDAHQVEVEAALAAYEETANQFIAAFERLDGRFDY